MFKVDKVFKHVENVFAREVGGRARGDICGDVETSTAVFTSDYSHSGSVISSNGAERESLPALNMADGKMSGIT